MVIAGSMMGLNESSINDMTAGIKPTDYSMCESSMEACYQMMSEVSTNENNFIKAVALKEMTYFQENGVEIVYEEGGLKALLDKAVAIVKSWFSKVMGVLQRVMTQIGAQLANITKSFGPNIKKLEGTMTFPADKAFKDYNYLEAFTKIANVKFICEGGPNPFAMIGKGGEDSYARTLSGLDDAARDFVASGKDITVANIKEKFLGNKDSNIDGSVYSVGICKAAVTGFKTGIDAINKKRKGAKDVTNAMIKELKAAEKEQNSELKGKENKDSRKANSGMIGAYITAVNHINAANSALLTASLSILIGHLNQAKKCTGIYLSSAKKDKKDEATAKKATSESAFDLGFDLV